MHFKKWGFISEISCIIYPQFKTHRIFLFRHFYIWFKYSEKIIFFSRAGHKSLKHITWRLFLTLLKNFKSYLGSAPALVHVGHLYFWFYLFLYVLKHSLHVMAVSQEPQSKGSYAKLKQIIQLKSSEFFCRSLFIKTFFT